MGPVTPYLCVGDAAAAIRWYCEHMGAELLFQNLTDDGKVMHARLSFNGGTVMLSDDFPEWNEGRAKTPEAYGGSPVTIHLEVPDADTTFERAVAGGAKVAFPLQDTFWGARYGKVVCPAGHQWDISTTKVQMTPESLQDAAKDWQAQL
jgi:PhnB protein